MEVRARFPMHNPVFPGKIYVILDGNGDRVAEIHAGSAQDALDEARANWPESRSAIKRNELAFENAGRKVRLSLCP